MERRRNRTEGPLVFIVGAILLLIIYAIQGLFSVAAFPGPSTYHQSGFPRPNDLDPQSAGGWKLTGEKSQDPYYSMLSLLNPDLFNKEAQGVMGASVDEAWSVTMGRPQTLIAALGTGIQWQSKDDMGELGRKFRLNMGELTPPLGSNTYDKNGDGIFNIDDYAGDRRVTDLNGNGMIDPEDLIWAFSDGKDNDNNGYIDDICGWDFLEDDNDPWDEVNDGGGTAQCRLVGAEANNQAGTPGACPNGMILPVRIGYSSLVDMNDFAQGVLYAVDSGAWIIDDGLEGLNNTPLAQEAIDYAWAKGVAVLASAGEGGAQQQTYPAAYEHTLQVNSVTKYWENADGSLQQSPASYLYLGGSSNYGAHSVISCSSDGSAAAAAATSAGIAGLIYSKAEDEIAAGKIWRYPGLKTPISACELKQLMALTADDINFSGTDSSSSLGALDSIVGPSQRSPSTAGWDPYFGYGRVNAAQAVRAVAEGRIPPEAEIRSPKWFEIINPAQVSLDITGKVAAVRADSFQYVVEYAAGLNPTQDQWIGVQESESRFEPEDGVLASLDLAKIYRTIEESRQAQGQAEAGRHAFTVRVRVRDNLGNWGEDRKVFFCSYNQSAVSGSPLNLASGISASPRLADLDNDGTNEIIVATTGGLVHAFKPDLSELPGWPVHATLLPIHEGAAAFSTAKLPLENYASINGAPAIGDLNHDGSLEVVAGDSEGRLYAWDKAGAVVSGFPVRSNPLYSIPDRNDWWSDGALPADWNASKFVPDRVHKLDKWNQLDKAFLSGPVLCNLDNSRDGSLEIIASSMDGHLYAWHADGKTLAGWPVKLIDPAQVSEFNSLTHTCKFKEPDKARPLGCTATSPSAGDVNGDGLLEVVCKSDEFYQGVLNVSSDSSNLASYLETLNSISGGLLAGGNRRAYAVYSQGAGHGLQAGTVASGIPANAYLPGWPASLAALDTGFVQQDGPAAIGDVDGDNAAEIGISAFAGPTYVLNPEGKSHRGEGADGLPLCLQSDGSVSGDEISLSAGTGGCFANLDSNPAYIQADIGIGELIDRMLPGDQASPSGRLSVWNVTQGTLMENFPKEIGDALSSPSVCDIDGDNNQDILVNSDSGLHAINTNGKESGGWPKFTGVYAMTDAVVGDCDGDGNMEVVAGSREGSLFVWKTSSSSSNAAEWPQPGRDPRGTSCIEEDGIAPGRIMDFSAELIVDSGSVKLSWTAPGDDGLQGQAMCFDIRYLDRPIDDSNWMEAIPLSGKPLPEPAGTPQEILLQDFLSGAQAGGGTLCFAMQCRDEAGNISAISNLASISF